jgi:hypothetical protein
MDIVSSYLGGTLLQKFLSITGISISCVFSNSTLILCDLVELILMFVAVMHLAFSALFVQCPSTSAAKLPRTYTLGREPIAVVLVSVPGCFES